LLSSNAAKFPPPRFWVKISWLYGGQNLVACVFEMIQQCYYNGECRPGGQQMRFGAGISGKVQGEDIKKADQTRR
jgi:hypothetical protein